MSTTTPKASSSVRPLASPPSLPFTHPLFQNRAVSCSSDLTLKLWDTSKSHQCVKTLYDHDHSVSSCRFVGPGDAHVVSASRDMTIKIWEVATSCVPTCLP